MISSYHLGIWEILVLKVVILLLEIIEKEKN